VLMGHLEARSWADGRRNPKGETHFHGDAIRTRLDGPAREATACGEDWAGKG
jgi:hypothetical protein